MLGDHLDDLLLGEETIGSWRRNADDYVQIADGSVFELIKRDFAPRAERMRHAIARENDFPRLFSQARENLTSVDGVTARLAERDAESSLDLITATVPAAFARCAMRGYAPSSRARRNAPPPRSPRTEPGSRRGSCCIRAARSRSAPRIITRCCSTRNTSIYRSTSICSIGENALAQTSAQAAAVAKAIDPKAATGRVFEELARNRPQSNGVIAAAESDLVRLRAFVLERHLISLPPDADIHVTAAPPFLRETEIASMDAPGPLEQGATRAFYNVTPPNPKWPKAEIDAFLGASFNDFERPLTSAHEVYPGHYTNYIIDRSTCRSA